jgi:hypothetical protein
VLIYELETDACAPFLRLIQEVSRFKEKGLDGPQARAGQSSDPFRNGNQLAKGRAVPYIERRFISGKPKIFALSWRLQETTLGDDTG